MSDTAYAGDPGTVGVLNVGAGDIKLSFDPANPAERIRAARIVKDMLRRGYALLVEREVDGKKAYQRAHDFDENTCEYILADFDPVAAAKADEEESADATDTDPAQAREAAHQKGTPRRGKSRVPAESTRAVSVGRTAGG